MSNRKHVSVRALTETAHRNSDGTYLTRSTETTGTVTVWDDDHGYKRILGYAEFPKGTTLPRQTQTIVEFVTAVEDRAETVHWKADVLFRSALGAARLVGEKAGPTETPDQ